MDVDMYFRRLIPQNLIDTSKYTSFYDILQGVQKLRRNIKDFLLQKHTVRMKCVNSRHKE